jgi:predicted CoA-binding protein
MNEPSDAEIRDILSGTRLIAMVGASPNPARPSFGVLRFLLHQGYRVIPINPGHAGGTIAGAPVVARLAGIDEPIDMVDVFRRSEALPALFDEILALPRKPRVIWTQLGVQHEEAAAKARAAGIRVVMNRCPAIEIPRLGLPKVA